MPMTRKISAGILLYRVRDHAVEVFLVHPGGPYWARKDDGAWSIPKGEADGGRRPVGDGVHRISRGNGFASGRRSRCRWQPLKQPGGKLVHAWAVHGDIDATSIRSNTFAIEWPPRSGKTRDFPEVDRGGWFDLPTARQKLLAGQRGFLDQLLGSPLQKRAYGQIRRRSKEVMSDATSSRRRSAMASALNDNRNDRVSTTYFCGRWTPEGTVRRQAGGCGFGNREPPEICQRILRCRLRSRRRED